MERRDRSQQPEEASKLKVDLTKYGYENDDPFYGKELIKILNNGSHEVVKEILDIYGDKITQDLVGAKNASIIEDWVQKKSKPQETDLIKMGILIDSGRYLKNSMLDQERIKRYIKYPLTLLEKKSFFEIVKESPPEKLAYAHRSTKGLLTNAAEGNYF